MVSNKFNNSGNMQGNIVNIGSTLRDVAQTINNLPNADQAAKTELNSLIQQLQDELKKVPENQATDADKVTKRVKELVEEANEEQPDEEVVQDKGKALLKAAKNLAGVLPSVVSIAGSIVSQIAGLGK